MTIPKKANIRTYGKFCSLFEAEVTKLRDVDADYDEVKRVEIHFFPTQARS